MINPTRGSSEDQSHDPNEHFTVNAKGRETDTSNLRLKCFKLDDLQCFRCILGRLEDLGSVRAKQTSLEDNDANGEVLSNI